ncbi:peroxiredoxin-like family protein [Aquimarina sp. W85]|uniref:peroxiredoxin-like family protein n=1 Tax=Aquimarina rhodophyticola TaxID=3342246 RepID=UPI00366DE5FB
MIKPRTKVPALTLDLINDTKWSLTDQNPDKFTLLVFYRGLHCPVCKKYLEDLTDHLNDFVDRGVNIIAISGDSEKRAKEAGDTWKIPSLPVGYGLSMEQARAWGLFISKGISDKEPKEFSEPGVFLIKPDQTLYFATVQTMPFARPSFKDIISAIDFIKKKDYPARGEA